MAGIVGAATNNGIGMAGVSWGARIMPIKFLYRLDSGTNVGTVADLVEAICCAA